jgi:DNA polymerase-1
MNPCEGCPHLKKNLPCHPIEGRGPSNPSVLILGWNPGKTELKEGKVLIGPSGQLLDKILTEIELTDVYRDNVVSCFTDIGKVTDNFIDACRGNTAERIKQINPKVIVLLGSVAVKSLFPDIKSSIAKLRTNLQQYNGIPTIVTYHPSAILRTGQDTSNLYGRLKADLTWAQRLSSGEVKVERDPVNYRILMDKEDVLLTLEYLEKFPRVACDFETNTKLSKNLWKRASKPMTLSLSGKEGESFCIPLEHPDSPFLDKKEWLYETLTDYLVDMKLIAHNAVFEDTVFHKFFSKMINVREDTILLSYLHNEFQSHKLHDLINNYTNIEEHKAEYANYPNTENDAMPLNALAKANLADTDGTLRIYNKYQYLLDAEDLEFYNEFLMGKFHPLVQYMHETGIAIDLDFVRSIIPYYIEQEQMYKKSAKDIWEININSSDQLSRLLLDYGCILPHTKTGGHSTNKEAMKKVRPLIAPSKLILIDFIQKYKEYEYLNEYYLSNIFDWVGEDGKVHSDMALYGTTSGRLSSKKPNIQNLAKDSLVKRMFITPQNGGFFVTIDYRANEFAYYAMLMRDKAILNALASGFDVHRSTASEIFNKPMDLITKDERFQAKTLNFGRLYGSGANTQSKQLGVSIKKAQELIYLYDKKYPSIKEYYQWVKNEYREKGYFKSPFGRKHRDNNLSFSQMVNLNIQGNANYIVLLAGFELLKQGFKVVSQVHDSLTMEFVNQPTPEELYTIYETCKNIKVPGYEDLSPWDGEIEIGKSFGSMIKL